MNRSFQCQAELIMQGLSNNQAKWHWPWISATLLLVYLTFFHLCLGSGFLACTIFGLAAWSLWFGVCYFNRSVFRNRFEYFIHQMVGLDILLEGFNPLHEGYGFYYCAIGFWTVFVIYHFAGTAPMLVGASCAKPEAADSSISM